MKVEFSAANLYRTNTVAKAKVSQAEDGRSKTDVAEFSRGVTTTSKNLVGLRAGLMRQVSQSASKSVLGALQQRIKDGTYSLPTDALVNSILNNTEEETEE